eukprot:TRINITY_DN207_c0_g5_i1.p1 TRINITY_DN207_c0_g5~~TRINITY_DN207_c0_g5_i1.p1  ORF type:complete len:181 (+),score=81.00 TRINITY_DN207_c0_g5_i1:355-897(+)
MNDQTNDTTYIYMGGEVPYAIDAGFQYSRVYDHWTPFIRPAGLKQLNGNPNIESNNWVDFNFEANENQFVKLNWKSQSSNGSIQYNQINVNVNECFVKRVTSIAQQPQNFYSSSFITSVLWRNCSLAISSKYIHNALPWSATNSNYAQTYPSNLNIIHVDYYDQSNEDVSIILLSSQIKM